MNNHHRCVLQANEARRPLCSAAAGQQANHHFGHAQLDFWIVRNDAVMARKRQLQAAAQGKTVQRTCDWLCRRLTAAQVLGGMTAGFHFAQQRIQSESLVERFFRAARLCAAQHGQVSTGQETGFLARCNDRALYGFVCGEIVDPFAEFFD